MAITPTYQPGQRTQDRHRQSPTAAPEQAQVPCPRPQARQPAALMRRATAHPRSLTRAEAMHLQRTIGNRALGHLLGGGRAMRVQPKLIVGPVGDASEQEADRLAQQVVARLDTETQPTAGQVVQRQAADDEELVQMQPTSIEPQHGESGMALAPALESAIHQARGGGQPLPEALRGRMEQAFGTDFGGVQVHTGPESDALNGLLGARAFTTGRDIFFRHGEFDPASQGGRTLLAHELTHVVQQRRVADQANIPLSGESALPRRLQAKWDIKKPDFTTTQGIEVIRDVVLKFKDVAGDYCIVKAEFASPSASLEILTQEIASWVFPEARIEVGDVTSHWKTILALISQHLKQADAARVTKAFQAALQLQQGIPQGHINIQGLAKGESTKAIAEATAGGVDNRMLSILADQKYLWGLGRLAAVDMYLVQTDRVLGGNFGNWMSKTGLSTDQRYTGEVSGLIDNTARGGNVSYFIEAKQGFDPLVGISTRSTGKISLQTSMNQPDVVVDQVIDVLIMQLAAEGVFKTRKESEDYSKRKYRNMQFVTFKDVWRENIRQGFIDGVQKLRAKAANPEWTNNILKQMTSYGVSDPSEKARIINQLHTRNHDFLGL